ncbi:MAG: DUF2226 domain-containing protein [Methanomicrobia archaeon]|nr:DUF2226 domain-containing protein [Methanomicrobia archaeon]
MYMPKGWLKTRIEEKDFHLNMEKLKEIHLDIGSDFSGYIRIFGTNIQDMHDDCYFLIENGKIIAAEKIEIERKIRTIRDDVFNELDCLYKECEINVVRLDKSQLNISKDTNEICLLDNGVSFISELNREELLNRISAGNINVDRFLYKFEKIDGRI